MIAEVLCNDEESDANRCLIVAAANLPLAAIAEELRAARAAREAAERECESLRAVVERIARECTGPHTAAGDIAALYLAEAARLAGEGG
jgi:hypothetical protein